MSRNALLLLSFLVLISLFSFTTFAVKAYRAKERALARQWFVAGERELRAGRAEAALEDFRSALIYSPNDSLVELQLAHALTAAGHLPEARAYLLGLWERDPGNGTVNLELARLAALEGKGRVAVGSVLHGPPLPRVHPDHALDVALRRLGDAPFLPVVHRADLTKLEGIVSLKDILKAYREAQLPTKAGAVLAGELSFRALHCHSERSEESRSDSFLHRPGRDSPRSSP